MKFASIIVTLLLISSSATALVRVNCFFVIERGLYSCLLFGVVIPNDHTPYVIVGQHLPGRTDQDVQRIQITHSSIPMILTELFRRFFRVLDLEILSSGLTTIQGNAFVLAGSLRSITITGNPLRVIWRFVFFGPQNLESLDLSSNQIDEIEENAIGGSFIIHLQSFILDNNNITTLPRNMLQSLITLRRFSIANNHLKSIDGNLLGPNRFHLAQLDFSGNQINAIERSFWPHSFVRFLNFAGNRCIDNFWIIEDNAGVSMVRDALETCFRNFDEITDGPDADDTTFIMKLQGSMVVRYENGTEIIRI